MTTSGTSSFNPAVIEIIDMAYRKIGAISEDETPTAAMYNSASFQLNSMIKGWMALGIHVWTEEEAILFLQQLQHRYLLGGTNTDNCCDANAYILAQLEQAAAGGATTVTLETAVGIADGNYFGVVLDSGAAFWTKVSGAPVGNVVTLAAPLPAGSSASAENFCFAYATKIVRPLKVPRVRLLTYQGLQETPMTVLSRKEYMNLPQKTNPGTPTQFFYTPQLVSGEFYAWPNPANANWGARMTWYRPLQDVTSVAQTADFPQEWINPLGWNLAREMGPEYGCPAQLWAIIKSEAAEKLDMVQSWDREPEPIYFGMSFDETQR